MTAQTAWELFRATGAPVFYLLYRQAAAPTAELTA